jgi:high-affinity Fe2+/Pb2+ permease
MTCRWRRIWKAFELVESSLDNVDANVRKDTEKSLMAYRQSLQDGLPVEQVEQRLEAAKAKLKVSAGLLGSDGLSWSLSFISGLLILLREGLEAILVLAAILAFRNTGQQSAVRSVNVGWGLALLAGLGTWALAAYVIDVSGSQRELLEGARRCLPVSWCCGSACGCTTVVTPRPGRITSRAAWWAVAGDSALRSWRFSRFTANCSK